MYAFPRKETDRKNNLHFLTRSPDIKFEPLWNRPESEIAQTESSRTQYIIQMVESGVITPDMAFKMLQNHGIIPDDLKYDPSAREQDAELMQHLLTDGSPNDSSNNSFDDEPFDDEPPPRRGNKKDSAGRNHAPAGSGAGGQFVEDDGGSGEKGDDKSKSVKTSEAEKQKKIASVKIVFGEDNVLPGLNSEDLEELGKENKPVLFKKSVIEKNKKHHPELSEDDYNIIVGQSLYNHDGIFPGHETEPRFNFVSRTGINKNALTLVEMAETKDSFEIINLHWIGDRQRKQKEKMKVKT